MKNITRKIEDYCCVSPNIKGREPLDVCCFILFVYAFLVIWDAMLYNE